jgi:hypothetical protein
MKQKAFSLEYFTVGWNVLAGVIAITAGILASSIELVGCSFITEHSCESVTRKEADSSHRL